MKKVFEEPKIEFIPIEPEDIITCSNGCDCPMKPGWGFGDDNHEHHHWRENEET